MSLELVKYKQPLNKEELSFLKRKEQRERKLFYRIARIFMILSFVCPFVVSWFRAAEGQENPFSYTHYFIGVLFLICFSGVGIYWGYYHNLRKVQQDIKQATKTIERTLITRKQYMSANNAYFFYLSSPVKLSIEVEENDYRRLNNGDEISIEYTSAAKLYLGYF